MYQIFAAARITICAAFFLYASWSDYKTREVSNRVWIILAPIAFALTFTELLVYGNIQTMLFYGMSFVLTTVFAIILFYAGGFGGADAKALMCLALALPFYPENILKPVLNGISPISRVFFPLTVFSNSVLLAAATAIYMILYNIVWHKKAKEKLFKEFKNESLWRKILVLITSYKMPIHKIREKWHIYPMEDIKEDVEDKFERKLVLIPKDEDREAILERLAKAVDAGKIRTMIWASPGLPMLIFITIGLLIALFFGDIIWVCIDIMLRR